MAWVCVLLKMDSAWSRDRLDVSLTILLLTCHDPDKAKTAALPEIMLETGPALPFGSCTGAFTRPTGWVTPYDARKNRASEMKKARHSPDLPWKFTLHRCQYIRGHRRG
jgi:hypothetical protein